MSGSTWSCLTSRSSNDAIWKTEVVVASLEMLSGRSKKEYAKEAQAAAEDPDGAPTANGATADSDLEAVVAM